MTVKFSHERKVRSFAKKTLGSTRVGSAIRLPAIAVLAIQFRRPLTVEKRNTYQEPTEEEVGWTSCGQLDGKVPSSAGAGIDDWLSAAGKIEGFELQKEKLKLHKAD
jgi:hypothetical protein